MNSLELEVVSTTKGGGVHVKVNDGVENLGILYLDRKQYEVLIGILSAGSFQKDVEFVVSNPFEQEDECEIFNYN
jgi:hypothetical protein